MPTVSGLYQVRVPRGVGPGVAFRARAGGKIMNVVCPPNIKGGDLITIRVPTTIPSNIPGEHHNTAAASEGRKVLKRSFGTEPPPARPTIPRPPARENFAAASAPPAPPPSSSVDADFANRKKAEDVFTELAHYSAYADLLTLATYYGGSKTRPLAVRTMHYLCRTFTRSVIQSDLISSRRQEIRLNRSEFAAMHKFVEEWRKSFDKRDADRTGNIEVNEIRQCLRDVGYAFSSSFFDNLQTSYDDDGIYGLSFDEFISVVIQIHSLTQVFKKKDVERKGRAEFGYEEYISSAIFSVKYKGTLE